MPRLIFRSKSSLFTVVSCCIFALSNSLLVPFSTNFPRSLTNKRLRISFSRLLFTKMSSKRSAESKTEDTVSPKKKAKSDSDAGPHIRDKVTPKSLPEGTNFLKIISYNVNGLKAVVTSKKDVLLNLVGEERPDILCFQETKLQTANAKDYKDLFDGYTSFWSCSEVKKGYSGTAIFLKNSTISSGNIAAAADAAVVEPKKKQKTLKSMWKSSEEEEAVKVTETIATTSSQPLLNLLSVEYDMGGNDKRFAGEGRTITMEFDKFILVACYVPNSGEGLVRLDYRVDEWDIYMREYLNKLSERKPVVFTGDLNVGHLDLDIHNPTAKHIVKQAGLTPRERESFTQLLNTNFIDAFRYYYPDARGQFTYWSMRTFARPVNKGIRLDYFICSKDMYPTTTQLEAEHIKETDDVLIEKVVTSRPVELSQLPLPGVYDSYIIHDKTVGCSDHCPVALTLKV